MRRPSVEETAQNRQAVGSRTRPNTNLLETAFRTSAIGKMNFLFIGDPDTGDRSATIYSLVVSGLRRGVDFPDCIHDVLSRLPTMTTRSDLTALLPAARKPAGS